MYVSQSMIQIDQPFLVEQTSPGWNISFHYEMSYEELKKKKHGTDIYRKTNKLGKKVAFWCQK